MAQDSAAASAVAQGATRWDPLALQVQGRPLKGRKMPNSGVSLWVSLSLLGEAKSGAHALMVYFYAASGSESEGCHVHATALEPQQQFWGVSWGEGLTPGQCGL